MSDWRSDVCSSDLGVELAERALDLGLIAGFEHLLARLESVADLLACCEHSASAGNHQRDDFLRCTEEMFQNVVHISSPMLAGPRCKPPRPAGRQQKPSPVHRAAAPRRSEEHTSELQSLMRISYAVFCLKKKK